MVVKVLLGDLGAELLEVVTVIQVEARVKGRVIAVLKVLEERNLPAVFLEELLAKVDMDLTVLEDIMVPEAAADTAAEAGVQTVALTMTGEAEVDLAEHIPTKVIAADLKAQPKVNQAVDY